MRLWLVTSARESAGLAKMDRNQCIKHGRARGDDGIYYDEVGPLPIVIRSQRNSNYLCLGNRYCPPTRPAPTYINWGTQTTNVYLFDVNTQIITREQT